jgi:TatD DNase family protein
MGVMHCFSSSRQLAEAALDIGFYISFSGIITFKNADELRLIAKDIPINKILIETDSPFLAPIPNRGKPNEPSFLIHTAKTLAEIKEVSYDNLSDITTENFFNLFKRAKSAL